MAHTQKRQKVKKTQAKIDKNKQRHIDTRRKRDTGNSRIDDICHHLLMKLCFVVTKHFTSFDCWFLLQAKRPGSIFSDSSFFLCLLLFFVGYQWIHSMNISGNNHSTPNRLHFKISKCSKGFNSIFLTLFMLWSLPAANDCIRLLFLCFSHLFSCVSYWSNKKNFDKNRNKTKKTQSKQHGSHPFSKTETRTFLVCVLCHKTNCLNGLSSDTWIATEWALKQNRKYNARFEEFVWMSKMKPNNNQIYIESITFLIS